MLQKESWTYISDNTNVNWVKIFHLYKGFNRKCTSIGFFTKGSCRIVEPPRIEYKGFRYKFSLKGDISKQLSIRVNKTCTSISGSTLLLNNNSSISIKKKAEVKSKYLSGPSLRISNRKKISLLFDKTL